MSPTITGGNMGKKIFRQAALDRLASPEKLDAPVRLVGAPGWLIVVAFVTAIAAGVTWAATVKAPIKVTAQGILIDRAGLVEIVANRAGLLEMVDLAPGDTVEVGQIVARMSRTDLRRDLTSAQAKLDNARERFSRLQTFYAEQKQREDRSDSERRKTNERTRQLLADRLMLLDEKIASVTSLVARNVVLRDRLIDAQVAASDVRERVSILEEEILSLDLGAVERESTRRLALLDERLTVEEQEREIARLTDQLNDEQVIRSSHIGVIAEVKVNAGDVIQTGTALATLAPVGNVGDIVAVLYIPPGEGKRVEKGMPTQILPSTVEREVYGYIVGEVSSVAPLPATPEGMRRTLQNDQLVTQLSANGAPIEVRILMKRDQSTLTGFAWSSSKGPSAGVNAGTLIEGQVIVDNVPIVDLVLPGASRMIADMSK